MNLPKRLNYELAIEAMNMLNTRRSELTAMKNRSREIALNETGVLGEVMLRVYEQLKVAEMNCPLDNAAAVAEHPSDYGNTHCEESTCGADFGHLGNHKRSVNAAAVEIGQEKV